MLIYVIQEDIKNAGELRIKYCPIANALRRQIPDDFYAVYRDRVIFKKRKEIMLSEFVSTTIDRFDSSGEMEPFTFDLPVEETS